MWSLLTLGQGLELHQFQEALLVMMAVCHSASKVHSLGIHAEAEKTETKVTAKDK